MAVAMAVAKTKWLGGNIRSGDGRGSGDGGGAATPEASADETR